jgi:hypothetical protein
MSVAYSEPPSVIPSPYNQAAIGGWHCLALDDDGQTYAWGGNEYNQCGLQVRVSGGGGWGGLPAGWASIVAPEALSHRLPLFTPAQVPARDILTPQPCLPHLRVKQVGAALDQP